MKKYKILISDYDGTLANSQNCISEKNLSAINAFVKRGGIFVVCSGRATDGISKILLEQNFNGLLASFNGAVLYDLNGKKIVYQKGIPTDLLLKITKYCLDNGLYFHVYPEKSFIYPFHTHWSDYYERVTKVKGTLVPDVLETVKRTSLSSPKFLVFDDKEKLDLHFESIKNLMPECEVARSTDNMIDLNLKGVDKGSACKMIAEHFGLEITDVIAVGDAGNDLAMIKAAGLSIAVSNATEVIKEHAKLIAPSNDEDAIAYVIENYCI